MNNHQQPQQQRGYHNNRNPNNNQMRGNQGGSARMRGGPPMHVNVSESLTSLELLRWRSCSIVELSATKQPRHSQPESEQAESEWTAAAAHQQQAEHFEVREWIWLWAGEQQVRGVALGVSKVKGGGSCYWRNKDFRAGDLASYYFSSRIRQFCNLLEFFQRHKIWGVPA